MKTEFRKASHTFIVSDLHLTEEEPPNVKRPMWKRYKRREFFIDATFERFLQHIQELAEREAQQTGTPSPSIELILNGDIFDFDAVMQMPTPAECKAMGISIGWLEKKRGLRAEEPKSRFKMGVILKHHEKWVQALRNFILLGHRAIFIIGNHDIELHWPAVQKEIREALNLPEELKDHVRFCEWFYISNNDTLVEHGNQYDAYNICTNPIHPLIKKGMSMVVRLPFGNIANKYMINGMGLFNPYVTDQYIMGFVEYLRVFTKHILPVQPLLILTWFWGACMTLLHSVLDGLLPAVKDPLTVERRIAEIARKANTRPKVVRTLKEIHVHPAYYNPFKIMRELWLDRALGFLVLFFLSFWVVSLLSLFFSVPLWGMLVPLALTMPFFVFYARSVRSELHEENVQAPSRYVTLSSRVAGVRRVVHGHTHHETHTWTGGASSPENSQNSAVELINTGTWSPAFSDFECTQPFGRKPFAWIRPINPGQSRDRVAELREWRDTGSQAIATQEQLALEEKSTALDKRLEQPIADQA